MTKLRVVIADDQPLMRAGFKAVLEATGDIEIVGEAGDGEEAVRAATEQAPDVVLMDIRMLGIDGIEATRRLPRQRVLILTTVGLDQYIIEALRAGASGSRPRSRANGSTRSRGAFSHVLGKLGLRDRVQAVIYAYETRLIAPTD